MAARAGFDSWADATEAELKRGPKRSAVVKHRLIPVLAYVIRPLLVFWAGFIGGLVTAGVFVCASVMD